MTTRGSIPVCVCVLSVCCHCHCHCHGTATIAITVTASIAASLLTYDDMTIMSFTYTTFSMYGFSGFIIAVLHVTGGGAAGWMQMPLDTFLEDVPPHKLVVLGNHRSAQSNVVFIRNSEAGRQLARDWLAIAVSGYVQCHGFDQVRV